MPLAHKNPRGSITDVRHMQLGTHATERISHKLKLGTRVKACCIIRFLFPHHFE